MINEKEPEDKIIKIINLLKLKDLSVHIICLYMQCNFHVKYMLL